MAADVCVPVNSRWVLYIALISDKLVVQFKNGDCALYPGSNEALFNRMRLAPSKGRFVNRFLRKLPYRKIAPPCPLADLTVNVGGCDVPRTLVVTQDGACAGSANIVYNDSTQRWEGTLAFSGGNEEIRFGYYDAGLGVGEQWYVNVNPGNPGACANAEDRQLVGTCDPIDFLSILITTSCCAGFDFVSLTITE